MPGRNRLHTSHQKGWDGSRLAAEVRKAFGDMTQVEKGITHGDIAIWDGEKYTALAPGTAGQ